MKLMKEKWYVLFISLSYFFLPVFVLLADTGGTVVDPCKGKICNPLGTETTLPEFIQNMLEGVIKIGIPLIVLAVIYCGFLFVFARGNPEEIGKAKDALLYTLIGSAILLGSWAIAEMISATITSLG
ncbi:TrbC/VirB2 family protein [Candidatus Nomurabacteria bacterium]|nr:TrbC/VirB2 family protein [Candidatus Nomurabacteria bacterium]